MRLFYRDPDFIIGKPGSPYMRRWYVIPRNRWFNIYLHNIVRSDDDRALHDHPWWNLSILLKGGYWEYVPFDPADPSGATIGKFRRAGSFVFRRASASHRLAIATGDSTWSLFITGRKVREWGFWCPQGWKVWTSFVDMTNTGAIGPGMRRGTMSLHLAKPEHEVAYQDLCHLVGKHAANLTAIEILAIAANMVGKMVALQDQRITTPEAAMKVVSANIEFGNRTVIAELAGSEGGRA